MSHVEEPCSNLGVVIGLPVATIVNKIEQLHYFLTLLPME